MVIKNINKKPRVLGVIPARGGSKRLPRKNILPLAGHPLISWTIRVAQLSSGLTDWLVTSEDQEILDISKSYGAPVPFTRPADLSGDEVRNIDTVRHALNFMEKERGYQYDIIILLQPTCPIRNPEHIDDTISALWGSPLDSLASVQGPFKKRDPVLKKIHDGVLGKYCDNLSWEKEEPFYTYNAAIYAVKREYFVANNKLISEKQVPFIMDKYHSTDIDEQIDLLTAETYINYLGDRGATPVRDTKGDRKE